MSVVCLRRVGSKLASSTAILLLLPFATARAEETVSGHDAAYIDWAVRNCAAKSNAREHGLIDQAKLKNEAAFTRDYLTTFQSKALAEAVTSLQKTDAMCADIKSWYGPIGLRVSDLIVWENSPPPDTPKAAAVAGKDGGRHGHRGQ